jgi:crotonobetainyl-CoA:carnitine CoA-transferase CaiB-like acyl-CoA transferase
MGLHAPVDVPVDIYNLPAAFDMALTKAQVFKAADALVAKGEATTWANVRKHLGGGSYSTIGKWIKEWEQAPERTPSLPPLPEALKAALLRFGAEWWAQALAEAEKAVAPLKTAGEGTPGAARRSTSEKTQEED